MNGTKLIILTLSVFFVLISSCKSDDPAGIENDWKKQNDTYFANMKDSVGYISHNVPDSLGGSSYYYKVTTAGDQNSVSPSYNDFVQVNYRGKLITGIIFDQTYEGINPPQDSTSTSGGFFFVNQLVKGWIENLKHMKVGERRTIILPQELGYGATGVDQMLLPYSATIWDVQLIRVFR